MIAILLEALHRLLIIALWLSVAWKAMWFFRVVREAIDYFQSRDVKPELRKVLAFLGFIEEDDK